MITWLTKGDGSSNGAGYHVFPNLNNADQQQQWTWLKMINFQLMNLQEK